MLVRKIKSVLIIFLAMLAAGTPVVSAQNMQVSTGTDGKSAASAKKPVKKKAKKKIRKPAAQTISEYKFGKIDHIPAYKFDKKANPILPAAKPAKKTSKQAKGGKAAAKTAVRQKINAPTSMEGGGQQQQQGDQQQQQGDQQPPQ